MEGIVGMIKIAITANASGGWIACNGAKLQIKEYPELFAVIGNRYGGNGKTTFSLPNPSPQPAGVLMIRAKSEGEDPDKFVGLVTQMVLWPTDKPPKNWLLCDGREVNGADFPLLQKLASQGMGLQPEKFNLPQLPVDGGIHYIICVEGKDPNMEQQGQGR